jgi:hypothetical protein
LTWGIPDDILDASITTYVTVAGGNMKRVHSGILSVISAILMAASFVIPANITAPSAVSADPGIMK